MATPTTLPDTPDVVSGNTRPNMFGTGVAESVGIQKMIDDLYNIWEKIGTGAATPINGRVLQATGTGTSHWGQVRAIDITPGTATVLKIAEVSGTGASGVLEFTGIPATYRMLELVYLGRSTAVATSDSVTLTFETSPTAGAYDYQLLFATAATPGAVENIGATANIALGSVAAASSTANLHGGGRILIPEYANTGMFKTMQMQQHGALSLATGLISVNVGTGVYEATAAIDRIRLTLASGSWATTSRATLYGWPA